MQEFINDFCYTLARIIEIEEEEGETKNNISKYAVIHNLLAECGQVC